MSGIQPQTDNYVMCDDYIRRVSQDRGCIRAGDLCTWAIQPNITVELFFLLLMFIIFWDYGIMHQRDV
jgi:hypothetical protein